jgi:hypothetical protein
MKENITYGECLSEILKALNLKSSSLQGKSILTRPWYINGCAMKECRPMTHPTSILF